MRGHTFWRNGGNGGNRPHPLFFFFFCKYLKREKKRDRLPRPRILLPSPVTVLSAGSTNLTSGGAGSASRARAYVCKVILNVERSSIRRDSKPR